MTITKTELLTTGKAKQVFATTDPDTLWLEYLDQATALNGKKKSRDCRQRHTQPADF